MSSRVVTLKTKRGTVKNRIKTKTIADNLFLEFGERVSEDGQTPIRPYHYVALMRGKPNYTKAKDAQQLYFTHKIRNKWWVYDDTCLKLVEDYKTKRQAVERLAELAGGIRLS